MPGRIWLIGGTQESATLARTMAQAQMPCTVTVTTEAARSLYSESAVLRVRVGKFAAESLVEFVQQEPIAAILDASHPFAVEISQRAIAVAMQYQIPYLRYERPEASSLHEPHPTTESHLPSFEALLAQDILQGQRVLLTIGYRSLAQFQPWHDRATLFARLLPSVVALEAALSAGFTSDRLIALRPPVSAALEQALWQQWQLSLVVTKASGVAGGEDVKRQVAAALGIRLVIIDRPQIAYPQQTSDVNAALAFCQTVLANAKLL